MNLNCSKFISTTVILKEIFKFN